MKKVKKSDGKTLSMPIETANLKFQIEIDDNDMQKIAVGHRPMNMDDRWFMYFADHILNIHRSWSGTKIYEIEFMKTDTSLYDCCVTVNANKDQYRMAGDVIEEQKRVLSLLKKYFLRTYS